MSYEYPKKLVDYLTEQEAEGSTIITTHADDAATFFVIPTGLTEWVTVVQWYEGMRDFSLVNINGKAFSVLKKTIGVFC